jgi:hypothetical protein
MIPTTLDRGAMQVGIAIGSVSGVTRVGARNVASLLVTEFVAPIEELVSPRPTVRCGIRSLIASSMTREIRSARAATITLSASFNINFRKLCWFD